MNRTGYDVGPKGAPDGIPPYESEVRGELERILASEDFRASERRGRFLKYVVEAALAGEIDRLKGYTIATEVFGRESGFNPQTDPIVRLEAGRLRRDLELYYLSSGKHDPILISIPKGGNIPVFERREGESEPGSARVAAEATEPAPKLPVLAARRRWLWVTVAGLALAIAIALLWQVFSLTTAPPDETQASTTNSPSARPREPSIAVLPFRDLSPDAAQEFFSDGITDRIITDLGRFRAFFVMALQSTLKYKNQESHPLEIARELGVDYIVEGSVARTDDMVRITARLVDTETGGLVWGQAYDRELDAGKIFDLQKDISQRVAASIGSRHNIHASTGLQGKGDRPPTSLDAYDCFLRYHSYAGKFNSERHLRVRTCLEQSVVDEPDYSEAWAMLALVYSLEHRQGLNPRPELYDARERSLEYAQRAVALDRENATAHSIMSLARFHLNDLDGFREAGERALAFNPNDPEIIHRYGLRLAFMGEWEQGLPLLRKAMELNPTHPGSYHMPFVLYYYDRGEYKRALLELREVALPDWFWYQWTRSITLAQLGRSEEARDAVERLLALRPGFQQEFWNVPRDWNFPRPLVEHIVDGLRKSGLDLAQEPSILD